MHLSLSVSTARRSLGESDAPLFIRQGAQRRRRTHTLLSHTRTVLYAHAYTGQAGNMTSSYNLDFLPDMMVESRLLVPGDRM